ncbi:FkbM family methyltransferase [Fretibacterium sp. OH1220_COT-178]|uniref:FkbM family methyltransferase n=1 Tax=Fretibacterium sp. OH1220_COT-178 TaxID=2491047 RepID=UPI000F5ED259|nr:FkbM family methyltransferase [Fretibacterium sp. OH1220_COT-178]RRD66105.1 FkbM family methyltransferase [Fretibacterium sp. OH1220_COT-178]
MLGKFPLRSFLKKVAWRLYAWAENLNDCNFESNGEGYFLSHLPFEEQKEPFIFFDVGANMGKYSQMLLKQFPDAEGHLFEPLPSCAAELRDVFIDNKTVHINEAAVSDEEETRSLWFADPQNTLASFYRRDPASCGVDANSFLEVKTITLESYIKSHGIKHIHLLKVDVEGHELKVLEGLGGFLRPDFIDLIQFEYGGAGIDSMTSLRSLYRLFESRGFIVCKLMPKGLCRRCYYPVMDNFQYSNYVAVSMSLPGIK